MEYEKEITAILLVIEKNDGATVDDICNVCKTNQTRAKFYIEEAQREGLIQYNYVLSTGPTHYYATHEGRRLLIDKGLA